MSSGHWNPKNLAHPWAKPKAKAGAFVLRISKQDALVILKIIIIYIESLFNNKKIV